MRAFRSLPAALGLLWLHSSAAVFAVGALLALCSLTTSQWIPDRPGHGLERRRAHASMLTGDQVKP